MDTAKFRPTGTDDEEVLVVAGNVEIVRPLTEDDQVDINDVGPMYLVRNIDNGRETHAFEGELIR